MGAKKLLSIAFAMSLIALAIWVPCVSGQGPVNDPDNDIQGPAPKQEGGGAEARLYFRGQGMTPTRPSGNQSEETVTCPGRLWGSRTMGTVIGQWSITIGGDTTASGSVSIVIWAASQAGAKNAGFRINLYRSGGNSQAYFTNRQSLSATPVKFTVDDSYNQQFSTGDTFDVQLVWLSDPQHFVGPSGGGEFLFGNAAYDSSVTLAFNSHPISIANITVPAVNKDTMDIKAEFHDILGCDPSTMVFNLAVSGAATASPANLNGPKPSSGGGNSSAVTWIWKHRPDGAKTGDYTITVSMSYDGNSTITNSTVLKVTVPAGGKTTTNPLDFGKGGADGYTLYILVTVLIIVIIIVAVIIIKKRPKMPKRRTIEEDEEAEEEEEDEDEDEDVDEDEDEDEEDEN